MKLSKRVRDELGRLVTVREAAALANVSESVIWQAIYRKELEVFSLAVSVDPEDVRRVVVSRRGRGRPRSPVRTAMAARKKQ